MFIAVILLFIIGLLYFFRRWDGTIDANQNILYCPCDGTVKKIVYHPDHIHIVIVLGIDNIHRQYAPFKCKVKNITHKKGTFNIAYFLEKSKHNERQEYILSNPVFGDVTFIQIAGQVARRIESFVDKGQNIEALDPIGIIKFGSRCDLLIPRQSDLAIHVQNNGRVKIGDEICSILQ